MGYYSTPREAAHYSCEHCSSHIREESDVAICAAPGCSDTLCDGCAFECAGCEEFYCASHIIATPAGAYSTYRCANCETKQVREAA